MGPQRNFNAITNTASWISAHQLERKVDNHLPEFGPAQRCILANCRLSPRYVSRNRDLSLDAKTTLKFACNFQA